MRKRDLEKLKKMLLLERQEIIERLLEIEHRSVEELNGMSGDAVDIATLEVSQKSLQKLGTRERNLLKKIDHALEKFETGDYGICELTGEPIPLERLMARPVAQYTVEAKELLEQQERRYRDPDDLEDFSIDTSDLDDY
jgi:DnaK suppressor protein